MNLKICYLLTGIVFFFTRISISTNEVKDAAAHDSKLPCQFEVQGKDDSFRIAWLVLAVAYIVPATLWVSWLFCEHVGSTVQQRGNIFILLRVTTWLGNIQSGESQLWVSYYGWRWSDSTHLVFNEREWLSYLVWTKCTFPYHPCMVHLPTCGWFFNGKCRQIYHTLYVDDMGMYCPHSWWACEAGTSRMHMWKTFDFYQTAPDIQSLQHWVTVTAVCLHSMGLSQSWIQQTLNNITFLNGEYETGWWVETSFYLSSLLIMGKWSNLTNAHIFQMGGKKPPTRKEFTNFLRPLEGFPSLGNSDRSRLVTGSVGNFESMKVLPSNLPYDFGIPVTFKAMVCFNIIQLYIYILYRYIMIYYTIEMYVYIYTIYICIIRVWSFYVMIPFLYSCSRQVFCWWQHPHLAVWQVSLEVIEARHVLQWTLFGGVVCVVGWHPLVECTHEVYVSFYLLLVYSWVIPGESIYVDMFAC